MFLDDPKPKPCWKCGSNKTRTILYAQNKYIVAEAQCLACGTAVVRKSNAVCSLTAVASLVDAVNGAWNHKTTDDSDISTPRMPVFKVEMPEKSITNHLRWKEF